MVGVAGFVALVALATLNIRWVIHFWWFMFIVVGVLLSARSGRAWAQGRTPEASFTRTSQPTVAVEGKAGATYVLLEPVKAPKGSRVRPRDFSPGWWAAYSVVVRAPVAFGDFILTIFWRSTAGLWGSSGTTAAERKMQIEHVDFPDRLTAPDRESF
jgi:predicted tellurium resistance membrane protein TerC